MVQSTSFNEIGYSDTAFMAGVHSLEAAQWAYLLSSTTMVAIVSILYLDRGVAVIGRILAYLFALSTITLTVKNVYQNYDYNYPRFVSCLHLACSGFVAFMILLQRWSRKGVPIKPPAMKHFFRTIGPISICFSANIVINNMALTSMGAGFVEMIGGCAPIFVFAITAVSRRFVNLTIIGPVLVVSMGTAMCAEGELKFTYIGLALALLATFLRALKSTMQHSLMSHETPLDEPMDPVEALAWLSVPSVVIMISWSMLTEGWQPFTALQSASGPKSNCLYFSLIVSSCNAIILNLANLFVIKDIGALGSNIVGQLKGILIILGGVAMLGERVGMTQCVGYLILVSGVFWYNRIEKNCFIKEELPSTETSRLYTMKKP